MEIGDIYAVEIPPTDGHEQAGTRPGIIVQAPEFEKRLPTVLLVPLTSQMGARSFPGTFVVEPDDENGLTMTSIVLTFQLRAIDRRRLGRQIGRLSAAHLTELQQQIRKLLPLA